VGQWQMRYLEGYRGQHRPRWHIDVIYKKEIAHERMHRAEERRTFTTQQVECQAEATAYCVCAALNIYVSDNLLAD